MKITVFGCGFLGSLWTEEFAKRIYALDLPETPEMLFVDRDVYEGRNGANQLFPPDAAGRRKTRLCQRRVLHYGIEAGTLTRDILEGEALENLSGKDTLFVVDALDNLQARYRVWSWAQVREVPVLHLGVAASVGHVEWSVPGKFEGWGLAPHAMRSVPSQPQAALPPCRLVRLRGLGLNMALAGAKAATLAMGFDIEEMFGHGRKVLPIYTQWEAGMTYHHLLPAELHVKGEEEDE